jgi:3-methyladenine DNA glycosylase AlkC
MLNPDLTRIDEYRQVLRSMPESDREDYLAANSGLPGPRGNLELILAAAEEGTVAFFRRLAGREDEFLAACGAVGLGRLAAGGDATAVSELHHLAGDARWRVREGVAMALQRLGDDDPERMLAVATRWSADESLLVRRAAIAGACEPRLLRDPAVARRVLGLLDAITADITIIGDRRSESFRVLRQALAYCWSVALAAAPAEGFDLLDRWAGSPDRDIRWIVSQNLKKARLQRADPDRAARLQSLLEHEPARPRKRRRRG